jgi:hypothetical protein
MEVSFSVLVFVAFEEKIDDSFEDEWALALTGVLTGHKYDAFWVFSLIFVIFIVQRV